MGNVPSFPGFNILWQQQQCNRVREQPDGRSRSTDPTLYTFPFPGYVHSVGTEKLGFSGPSVLYGGAIPTQVIFLLNQPWTNPNYCTFLAP
jgi:hypothetical protein